MTNILPFFKRIRNLFILLDFFVFFFNNVDANGIHCSKAVLKKKSKRL